MIGGYCRSVVTYISVSSSSSSPFEAEATAAAAILDSVIGPSRSLYLGGGRLASS